MKIIITESQYNKAIDRFITFELEPHEVKTSKKYPNSVFWVKDDKFISEIVELEYFWVHYNIWETISKMFSLDFSETQQVIKIWLEEHYNLGELIPKKFYNTYTIQKIEVELQTK